MLNRKYYQMLADTISIEEFTQNLCGELKADNYNFNKDLFLKRIAKGGK